MNARFLLILGTLALLTAVFGLGASEDDPAAAEEQLWKRATTLFKPLPPAAPKADNPITAAKVELGKMLYFDPRLSKEGNISCNSCHSLATFGVDNLPTSPGDAGELGDRNSPTVLNAALHAAQFWDGRAEDVEEQAGMPVLDPVEMGIPSEDFLVARLSQYPEYQQLFAKAFPEEEFALSYPNVGKALAAFERTLLTPSRFDRYLEGDRQALTRAEKEGMRTFIGFGCTSCHNGVNVGGHIFRKFGLNDRYWHHTRSERVDEGRYQVTGEEEDKYVFKVASLRNVAKTYPYFHDGSVESLDEAVRIMVELQVGVDPGEREVETVVAFFNSLTGELPDGTARPPEALGEVPAAGD